MKRSKGCTNQRTVSNLTGVVSTNVKPTLKQSVVALAVAQSLSMAAVEAATINVGGPDGQGCGLSAAILSANEDISHPGSNCTAGSGDDVIELNRDVTISRPWFNDDNGVRTNTYTSMPLITSNVTINGNGHTLARSSSTTEEFRLLAAQGTNFDRVSLTLNELTLTGGKITNGEGSALYTPNTDLYLNGVTIENNEASDSPRGYSRLTSTVSGNTAPFPSRLPGDRFTISDSTIINNIGHGVRSYVAPQSITNSNISNNSGIGLFVNAGSTTIQNSAIDNNGAGIIFATNLFSSGNFVLENSSISGNSGPAIQLFPNNVDIIDSVIDNNVAGSCAGLNVQVETYYFRNGGTVNIVNSSISNNVATASNGGAICLDSGQRYGVVSHDLTVVNSTLSGNSAALDGGAIFSSGPTLVTFPYFADTVSHTIINSTLSGNSAGRSGGAIFSDSNTFTSPYGDYSDPYVQPGRVFTIVNSTIAGNTAGEDGGGLAITQSYLNISNSIISGNVSSSGIDSEISANEATQVVNFSNYSLPNPIVSMNSILGSSATSNFQAFSAYAPSGTNITATIDGTNPTALDSIIAPLQDNGGPTLTHALVAGSPALDAGDLDTCVNDPVGGLDQRGETRGDDGLCDIGAYEAQGNLGGLPSIDIDSVEVSEADASATLTITLSSPQTNRIPVDFQTIDGTANEGLDFTGRLGTMSFAPGQTRKIRTIQIDDDNLAESTENFSLLLSNPVGATLDNAEGVVTILDDDGFGGLPSISIESGGHSITERDSGNRARIVYTVTLSSAQTENVTVDFQTVDETAIGSVDYETRSGTMTFAPGQTSKVRAITVLSDTDPEADETFRFILSNPSSNAALSVDDADTIGTIIDDD